MGDRKRTQTATTIEEMCDSLVARSSINDLDGAFFKQRSFQIDKRRHTAQTTAIRKMRAQSISIQMQGSSSASPTRNETVTRRSSEMPSKAHLAGGGFYHSTPVSSAPPQSTVSHSLPQKSSMKALVHRLQERAKSSMVVSIATRKLETGVISEEEFGQICQGDEMFTLLAPPEMHEFAQQLKRHHHHSHSMMQAGGIGHTPTGNLNLKSTSKKALPARPLFTVWSAGGRVFLATTRSVSRRTTQRENTKSQWRDSFSGAAPGRLSFSSSRPSFDTPSKRSRKRGRPRGNKVEMAAAVQLVKRQAFSYFASGDGAISMEAYASGAVIVREWMKVFPLATPEDCMAKALQLYRSLCEHELMHRNSANPTAEAFLVSRMMQARPGLVSTRKYHMMSYEDVVVGSEVVDWMAKDDPSLSRADCVAKGQALMDAKLLCHVTDEHQFEDGWIFYRLNNSSTAGNTFVPSEDVTYGFSCSDVEVDVFFKTFAFQLHSSSSPPAPPAAALTKETRPVEHECSTWETTSHSHSQYIEGYYMKADGTTNDVDFGDASLLAPRGRQVSHVQRWNSSDAAGGRKVAVATRNTMPTSPHGNNGDDDSNGNFSTSMFENRYSEPGFPLKPPSFVGDILESIGGVVDGFTSFIFKPKSHSDVIADDAGAVVPEYFHFPRRNSTPNKTSHRKSKSSPNTASFLSPGSSPNPASFLSPYRDCREKIEEKRTKNWTKILPHLHRQKQLGDARKMSVKGIPSHMREEVVDRLAYATPSTYHVINIPCH
jgi:hypothetical protein